MTQDQRRQARDYVRGYRVDRGEAGHVTLLEAALDLIDNIEQDAEYSEGPAEAIAKIRERLAVEW